VVGGRGASGDGGGAELTAARATGGRRRSGRQETRWLGRGLLGPRLLGVGATPLPDSAPRNPVMGVVEVLKHLGELRRNTPAMRRALDEKPDLRVVIDPPDFNLPPARAAKAPGRPVPGPVSPLRRAWRAGRT